MNTDSDGNVLRINIRDEIQAERIKQGQLIAATNPLAKRLSASKLRWAEEAARMEILRHPITSENINYRLKLLRQRKLKPRLDNADHTLWHCLFATDRYATNVAYKRTLELMIEQAKKDIEFRKKEMAKIEDKMRKLIMLAYMPVYSDTAANESDVFKYFKASNTIH